MNQIIFDKINFYNSSFFFQVSEAAVAVGAALPAHQLPARAEVAEIDSLSRRTEEKELTKRDR